MPPKEQPEVVDTKIACPCGGSAFYTTTEDGEPASLLHSLPICHEYEKLNPADYLRWIRAKIEGRHDA